MKNQLSLFPEELCSSTIFENTETNDIPNFNVAIAQKPIKITTQTSGINDFIALFITGIAIIGIFAMVLNN